MALHSFRLDTSLTEHGVWDWYHTTALGDTAVVAVPDHDCKEVRLLRWEQHHVHRWPLGESGMTMPLEEAVARLQVLLHAHRHEPAEESGGSPTGRETPCSHAGEALA